MKCTSKTYEVSAFNSNNRDEEGSSLQVKVHSDGALTLFGDSNWSTNRGVYIRRDQIETVARSLSELARGEAQVRNDQR